MKTRLLFCVAFFVFFVNVVFSQTQPQPTPSEPILNISDQITKIAKSVDALNIRLKNFSDTFTSSQGLRLSNKQQQLLFAFELLNRAEASLTNLQKMKLDLLEKQISTNNKLNKNLSDSRIESIDKTLGGTTNAEEIREYKIQALNKERDELTNLLIDIQTRLNKVTQDIRQTELFINNIRNRIFTTSEDELKDL